MTTQAPAAPGFAAALREATTGDHQRTESAGFMSALMKGGLERADVAALAARLLPVYAALEDVGRDLADDPVAGPFVDPRLDRVPALEADLAVLLGQRWRELREPSPVALEYAEVIAGTRAAPLAFVAHHYTRYLGDLSGGQAIGAVIRREYGLQDGGASFYVFDEIEDAVAYKRGYRELLDALPNLGVTVNDIAVHVHRAYAFNGALFAELDARPLP
jgi:heme oxygenase